MNKPAALGGAPAFPQKLRLLRPTMPSDDEFRPYLETIRESGWQSNFGPFSQRLEELLAERLEVEHCLALANLSTGLMYMPMAAGLHGGEVIVPSYTFVATAHSMKLGGLTPVFADIDPITLTLDPVSAAGAVGPDTVAICAVHIFGTPCDIEGLGKICDRHGLALLFDSAHALGSTHKGKPIGGFGLAEGFSFSVTKIVTTLGEGGVVCTDDDSFAERIRMARNWGHGGDYNPKFASIGSKMPEINASAGILEIGRLDGFLSARQETARQLIDGLGSIPGIRFPSPLEGDVSAYKEFAILIDAETFGMSSRRLARALASEGVETRKYFAPCLHQTDAYKDTEGARRVPLDHSERISNEVLSIPFHTHMADADVDLLCETIRRVRLAAPEICAKIGI